MRTSSEFDLALSRVFQPCTDFYSYLSCPITLLTEGPSSYKVAGYHSQHFQHEFEFLPTNRISYWSPQTESPCLSTSSSTNTSHLSPQVARNIRPLPLRSCSTSSITGSSTPTLIDSPSSFSSGSSFPLSSPNASFKTQFNRSSSLSSLSICSSPSMPHPGQHFKTAGVKLDLQQNLLDLCKSWSNSETLDSRRHLRCWPQTATSSATSIRAIIQPVAKEHFNFDEKVVSLILKPDTKEYFMTCEDVTRIMEILLRTSLTSSQIQVIGKMMLPFKPMLIIEQAQDKEGDQKSFFNKLIEYRRPKVTHMTSKIAVMRWSTVEPFLVQALREWVR